jgi:hypothetical protein
LSEREVPDTNRLGGMVQASQFIGNSLRGSRLTPILLWSYIASKGSSAASQRQYPQAFISDIDCRVDVSVVALIAMRTIKYPGRQIHFRHLLQGI